MTKVQVHFNLERPLDEALMLRLRDAQAVYGIEHIKLSNGLNRLNVEYDASRLSYADVEATLRKCGLPVVPILQTTA